MQRRGILIRVTRWEQNTPRVNFALTENAATNGSVPTVIQTAWNVNPGLVGAVTLYGYFDVPAQALTDGGGNNIPTSWVEGQMTTGTGQTLPAGTYTGVLRLQARAL